MAPKSFTRILLNERPTTDIKPSFFKSETVPYDSLKVGNEEALVKVNYFSLDPAMRSWISGKKGYAEPVKIGDVMRAYGLGTVVEAGSGSKFKAGDVVIGLVGWQEYVVFSDKAMQKVDPFPGTDVLDRLNVLGIVGFTAYFGLQDIGQIKPGETLVVSGAAGGVGSIVCQLGKAQGAKVIAIAGGPEKCQWLEKDVGVEKVFDYKSSTFKEDFNKEVKGVDVYFDNVGGEILDMVLTKLNQGGRIPLCGGISQYNSANPTGSKNYMALIATRGKMQGFIVSDHQDRFPEAIKAIAKVHAETPIKTKFHIVEGLEKAPETLPILYTGGNTGKLLIKVADGLDTKY